MVDEKTTAIITAKKDSIQSHPDATKGEAALNMGWQYSRGPFLSVHGKRARERELNLLYWFDYNWMVKSAFTGLMKKVAATPSVIKGPDDISTGVKAWYYKQLGRIDVERPDIEYWEEIRRQANFGAGWNDFIKMGVDYLKQDSGWYWELIAPGDPKQAPTGAVTGIAHLDSLRCIPTGDPEYPVIYCNRENKFHLLHHTRVVHMVDMPSGDINKKGYGLCALSRAVVISNREMNMAKYIDLNLDDKPPPGVVVASGMTNQEFQRAAQNFKAEQSTDEQPLWGKQLIFYAADATLAADLKFTNFAQAPEKFSFKEYTEIDVDSLALALGVDRQELWQLTGGNIGSAGQSEVLNRKGRGRAIADIYTNIEWAFNSFLPPGYTFEFISKDENEDLESAELAAKWTDAVNGAGANLSQDEARQVLADQVPAYHAAITDESGQVVPVDELDGQPEEEKPPTIVQVVEETKPDEEEVDVEETKEYGATREKFVERVGDIIGTFVLDQNRPQFGIYMRRNMRVFGQKAFIDGLEEGGVTQTALDTDEKKQLMSWIARQSPFITRIGKEIKDGLVISDTAARAEMWANKSLREIYTTGMLSADANGMYQWDLGAAVEHCKTCLRLDGQIHRLKDWMRRGLWPGCDKLICKGFRCTCDWHKVTGRARGRF